MCCIIYHTKQVYLSSLSSNTLTFRPVFFYTEKTKYKHFNMILQKDINFFSFLCTIRVEKGIINYYIFIVTAASVRMQWHPEAKNVESPCLLSMRYWWSRTIWVHLARSMRMTSSFFVMRRLEETLNDPVK